MQGTKICSLCDPPIPLSISNFGRSRKNKDGLDSRCKACRAKKYAINTDILKMAAKKNYQKNAILRRRQKSDKYASSRESILLNRRKRWATNPHIKENRDKYWESRKKLCFEILGDKCKECGENDSEILTIDHIHNDGNTERNSGISNLKIWNKVISGTQTDKYQILCFNCNFKKSLIRPKPPENGINKLCPTCMTELDTSLFKMDRKYRDGLYYECKSCTRKRDEAVKTLAFLRLGSSSCVCGQSDRDVLTIDHIHNDGNISRKVDKTGIYLYRKLMNGAIDRNKFQILCFNCNIKKHLNKDILPSLVVLPREPIQTESIQSRDFELKDVSLKRLDNLNTSAIILLNSHHYAGYGRHGTAIYGGFIADELVAVFKLCPPIRVEVATSLGLSPRDMLEIDRVCLIPDCHKKNLISYLLSRLITLIRNDFPNIKGLVSFADPGAGHDGAIYKASNWIFVGSSSRSYEYVSMDGKCIHKKTVYNAAKTRGLKEREYSDLEHLTRRHTVSKLKFFYRL